MIKEGGDNLRQGQINLIISNKVKIDCKIQIFSNRISRLKDTRTNTKHHKEIVNNIRVEDQ